MTNNNDAASIPHAAPEREVATDIFRRGLIISPALLLLALIFWGLSGLSSSAVALGIVLANFLAGAWIIDWAVKISPQLLMSAVLGGFVFRMGVITATVLPIRNQTWFEIMPFALVLILLHLGLLIWETRYVSATLRYPGLKPREKRQKRKKSLD